MRPRIRSLAAAGLAGALLGCSEADPASPPDPGAAVPTEALIAEEPSPEEWEALMALGYLQSTEDRVDPSRSGVVRHEVGQAQEGYRLYCMRGIAELISLDGRAVRRWEQPDIERWSGCALMPNGDLLVLGNDLPEEGAELEDRHRHLRRIAWNGELLWRKNLPVHHDVVPLPGGGFLALMLEYGKREAIHPTAWVRDDVIARLTDLGEVVETRSILEVFRINGRTLRLRIPGGRNNTRPKIDVVHANTIEPVVQPHLQSRHPIYAAGNVVWTSRHQHVVAIVEWSTNQLLWAWGQGLLRGPHEGRVLANGNVLVLDNGFERRGSRVLEVDPISNKVVWMYRGERPKDFFTRGQGGAQRLANGNTLITESDNARAFEVTPDKRIVWEFLGRDLDEEDKRLTFRRMRHYDSHEIAPLRSGEAEGPEPAAS